MINLFGIGKKKEILELRISVVVTPDEEGYHAYTPALKGLHVDGATAEEALKNAAEAIKVYLTSLAFHHDPLPIGPDLSLIHEEIIPEVPPGALLRHVTMQWPSLNMSGTN